MQCPITNSFYLIIIASKNNMTHQILLLHYKKLRHRILLRLSKKLNCKITNIQSIKKRATKRTTTRRRDISALYIPCYAIIYSSILFNEIVRNLSGIELVLYYREREINYRPFSSKNDTQAKLIALQHKIDLSINNVECEA